MQEVTSTATSTTTSFDQLRTSALVDVSSQARAFSDFMNLATPAAGNSWTSFTSSASGTAASPSVSTGTNTTANTGIGFAASTTASTATSTGTNTAANATTTANTAATAAATTTGTNVGTGVQNLLSQINTTPDVAPVQPLVQSDTASTLATTTSTQASTNTFRAASTKDTAQGAAKNTTVSRQSFEESKPLLLKAGLSDKEITDLSARVQAGTLTWGQLVQTIGTHTTGAKKSVSLSSDDSANLQSMFQKLGFNSDDSASMVKSVSQGDGLKVLSSIQTKLNNTAADATPSLNSGELSTFFKALNLPGTTADALTQKLAGDKTTVADISTALATISQTMQEQRAKSSANDTEVAKGLAKIMDKDVAKTTRDTTGTTASTSGGQVRYDLKTKDKNDTSWYNEHEQNQQKASDDAWRNFNSKVRTDDSATQQSASATATTTTATAAAAAATSGTSAGTGTGSTVGSLAGTQAGAGKNSSLDAALTRAAQSMATPQGKADTTQQASTFENVTAPKVLDQVTQAMLKDLGQGRKQLTMELTPENLGKVQVMLQVKGKEVSAVISAEDSSTAAMLNSNMDGLKKSLEDKGLTVQNMEVQTGLSSRQDQQASFNADQHNQQAQEQQDMSRIFSQLRAMRSDSSSGALDMQNANMQAILADQGLHIIA